MQPRFLRPIMPFPSSHESGPIAVAAYDRIWLLGASQLTIPLNESGSLA